jgi:oligoribonuclease (3'-5' exoribonuclease)
MADLFLPESLCMIDAEMTGVIPSKDALLQVSALKLKLNKQMQYEVVGDHFDEYLCYKGQPTTSFHKKYLTHIFEKCNESSLTPEGLKKKLHSWLGDLKGKVIPTGDCVPHDIYFLKVHKCIDEGYYEDDKPVPGTFHYEFWDMNPLKDISRQIVGNKYEVEGVDKENQHDALVDCLNQTLELNHALKILLALEK